MELGRFAGLLRPCGAVGTGCNPECATSSGRSRSPRPRPAPAAVWPQGGAARRASPHRPAEAGGSRQHHAELAPSQGGGWSCICLPPLAPSPWGQCGRRQWALPGTPSLLPLLFQIWNTRRWVGAGSHCPEGRPSPLTSRERGWERGWAGLLWGPGGGRVPPPKWAAWSRAPSHWGYEPPQVAKASPSGSKLRPTPPKAHHYPCLLPAARIRPCPQRCVPSSMVLLRGPQGMGWGCLGVLSGPPSGPGCG